MLNYFLITAYPAHFMELTHEQLQCSLQNLASEVLQMFLKNSLFHTTLDPPEAEMHWLL